MNEQQEIWTRLTQGPQPNLLINMVMNRVAHALSDMIGRPIHHRALRVGAVPMAEIVQRAGNPKEKAAGVRLEIHGDAQGQALLLLPWPSALRPWPGPSIYPTISRAMIKMPSSSAMPI